MKTLEDLVEELNEKFTPGYVNHFFEFEDDEVCRCFILYRSRPMVEFDKKYKTYSLLPAISNVKYEYQKLIVEYLANTDKTDWFPQKKYNIIIGKDITNYNSIYQSAYLKDTAGNVSLCPNSTITNLENEKWQFTQKEIEELKARLPDNMAKIVDLGKVEVRDA